MRSSAFAALLLACLAAPAAALVVAGTDPGLAEEPPAPDPGWDHVGRRGGTTAIYLGGGWVLTARHSQMGEVQLGGVAYPPVPDSMLWLDAVDAPGKKADLILFRIDPAPRLPALRIRHSPPPLGAPALLIGYGAGRGASVQWKGLAGYETNGERRKRWGTSNVLARGSDVAGPNGVLTRCFRTGFLPGTSPLPAQAAVGDSGGAVFVRSQRGWLLAGVMVAVGSEAGQPSGTALPGNVTEAADLSAYGPQIERALAGKAAPGKTELPAPSLP